MKNITEFINESISSEAKKIASELKKDKLVKTLDDVMNQLFAAEDEREYPQIEDYPELKKYGNLFDYDDRGYISDPSELGQEVCDILKI